ncbi:MAG: energy transducer TonB [Candidatus Oxydemutatoraceae bacterium WSBS_2016_MAG_OTU14]
MILHAFQQPLRFVLTLGVALSISYSLFHMLEWMTQQDTSLGLVERQNSVLDFVRLREEKLDTPQQQRPPDKPKAQQRPQLERPQYNALPQTNHLNLKASLPSLPRLKSGLNMGALGHGGLAPRIRVRPMYPLRAQMRGIEGWVEIEFSINELGKVVMPRVVKAKPRGEFEQAALKAVRRWSYEPYIVNDKAVRRNGISVIIDFVLQK